MPGVDWLDPRFDFVDELDPDLWGEAVIARHPRYELCRVRRFLPAAPSDDLLAALVTKARELRRKKPLGIPTLLDAYSAGLHLYLVEHPPSGVAIHGLKSPVSSQTAETLLRNLLAVLQTLHHGFHIWHGNMQTANTFIAAESTEVTLGGYLYFSEAPLITHPATFAAKVGADLTAAARLVAFALDPAWMETAPSTNAILARVDELYLSPSSRGSVWLWFAIRWILTAPNTPVDAGAVLALAPLLHGVPWPSHTDMRPEHEAALRTAETQTGIQLARPAPAKAKAAAAAVGAFTAPADPPGAPAPSSPDPPASPVRPLTGKKSVWWLLAAVLAVFALAAGAGYLYRAASSRMSAFRTALSQGFYLEASSGAQSAEAIFHSARNSRPAEVPRLRSIAAFHAKTQTTQALQTFFDYGDIAPAIVAHASQSANLAVRLGDPSLTQSAFLFDGFTAYSNGDPAAANAKFSQALAEANTTADKSSPAYAAALLMIARGQRKQGNLTSALDNAERALHLAPTLSLPYLDFARILVEKGDVEEAALYYENAVLKQSGRGKQLLAEIHWDLARLERYHRGDRSKACTHYEAVRALAAPLSPAPAWLPAALEARAQYCQ